MPLYITVHNTGRQCVEQTEKKKKRAKRERSRRHMQNNARLRPIPDTYVRGSIIVAATLHLRKRAGDRGVHPQRLTDCLMHMNFTRVGSARADVRPGPWVPRLTHTYIGSKGPDRISPDRGVGEGLLRSCSFSLRDKEWCKKKKKGFHSHVNKDALTRSHVTDTSGPRSRL